MLALLALSLGQQPGGFEQPLGQTIMQVFDKDKSGGITSAEVNTQLTMLAGMAGGMDGGGSGPGSEVAPMINAAKKFAPDLIKLLDSDGSEALDAKEVAWIEQFQTKLKSGVLRNLTRDVFAALDADADDALNADEIGTDDASRLASVVELVREAFPLPNLLVDTSDDAQRATLRKHLASALKLLDGDGDGIASRSEAGKAFKDFRTMFLKAARTLKEMGPMLAMFGGMDLGDLKTPGGMPPGMGGAAGGAKKRKPPKSEL